MPSVYHELSSKRLLVLSFVDVPCATPDVPERKDAARQLIESYYRQVLVDGFFHADPHPGNLLVGRFRVLPRLRHGRRGRLAHPRARADARDGVLAGGRRVPRRGRAPAEQELLEEFDLEAFQHEIATLVQSVRGQSLQEIQLGPILQGITEIAARRDVRLPRRWR